LAALATLLRLPSMSGTARTLSRFSIGVGDRFGAEAGAQLQACTMALDRGVEVTPVWNKSNREHNIIGSDPNQTRRAADQAVSEAHWRRPYFVDADHINTDTVGRFLQPCDFFTIDVADWIGKPADSSAVDDLIEAHPELIGTLNLEGVEQPLTADRDFVVKTANKFLRAVQEAGRTYRHIQAQKGENGFVTEVSMDETDSPQTPAELLIILAAIASEGIPIRTIAPKFSGRFNKGVDYVGDVPTFAKEFAEDIAVIRFAVERYGLPADLKLSVHSGSDKFSIYSAICETLQRTGAGVHLKTAGTTWLEELIGLAEAEGDGLQLAKEVYEQSYLHRTELCAPYAAVIDIDPSHLPAPEEVNGWTSAQYTGALRHDQGSPSYNKDLRQLLHVAFKVAAKLGSRYTDLLAANRAVVAKNVTDNLYQRHIKPVFIG
jgi:tagaturonate epimerase